MPKFSKQAAPIKVQAKKFIDSITTLNQPKHNSSSSDIFSIGKNRVSVSALGNAAQWIHDVFAIKRLSEITSYHCYAYLADRSIVVKQSQLNTDKVALQSLSRIKDAKMNGEKLTSIKSLKETILRSRAYTQEQTAFIMSKQSFKNALATDIANAGGLRAHELLTLRRTDELTKSEHRTWSSDRFVGREGVRYSVTGKGGLIREILIPNHLAERLELTRMSNRITVTDRGIFYEKHYDIGGGNAWSKSFSKISKSYFNWSSGAHGLRFSYAQKRMFEIQNQGLNYENALRIVSQELGHFRPEVTKIYLR